MIQSISNTCNYSPCSPNHSEMDQLMDRLDYFLRFLDPSSRKPGIIGMISWEALREGLEEIQEKLILAIDSGKLTQNDLDKAYKGLSKIEIALERIS